MDEEKDKEKYWLDLENLFVHHVYENISNQFQAISSDLEQTSDKCIDLNSNTTKTTSTRLRGRSVSPSSQSKPLYNAWPKVKKFIENLEPNSFIADVGSGEGKYLNLNQNVFSIGKIF